uniref:Uncharacterized protein LOC117350314 n=1 Tax=Geotrypetes seraphini TaxID=260995 RepID=A0A6P8PZE5_GEOSA|nr:uncharacterized protein LOC117350314 [Geotrypetes seraphini]
MWTGALLCFLLLGPAVREATELNYVVLVPAVLEFPSEQTACVHLCNFTGTVDLTISLLRDSDKTNLFIKKKRQPKPQQCFTFQVPAPREGKTEEVSTFQVKIHSEGNVNITETKKVLIRHKRSGTIIQTDKPIYKPGEKVKFRMITFDDDFIASNDEYSRVMLQDPKENQIGQWMNVMPTQGIVDLSFTLSSEPTFGTYTISVKDSKASFSVEEYVVPKYEVIIRLPKFISCMNNNFKYEVCGRYTYGKPVQGTVQATLCRKRFGPGVDLCEELKGQTDRTGCISVDIELSENFTSSSPEFSPTLQAHATLVEDGTDVEINGSFIVILELNKATITFDDVELYYKTGLTYKGKLKLKATDGKLLENKKIMLKVKRNGKEIKELHTTDESGMASFILDTSSWDKETITLTGEYNEEEKCGNVSLPSQLASLTLTPFYAESKSFVKLRPLDVSSLSCDKEEQVMVDYIIDANDLKEETRHLNFFFIVVGKNHITEYGKKRMDVNSEELKNSFSITLPISADTAPSAYMLVYAMLPNGKLVADGVQYKTSKCFKNKVKLTFSEEESLPGASVDLQLQAAPGSLCGIRAVDKNVLLLRSEPELSISTVYKLFPAASGYPHPIDEHSCNPFGIWRRPWQFLEPDLYYDYGRSFRMKTVYDTFHLFKDAGIKIITNSKIQQCDRFPDRFPYSRVVNGIAGMPGGGFERGPVFMAPHIPLTQNKGDVGSTVELQKVPESVPAQEEKVRQIFIETWLWDLKSVNFSGHLTVPVTVPDAITEWQASMMCVANIGFGLSQKTKLRVFKPFFADMSLPYSVIRGESFPLKATAFNYMKKCIKVKVTLLDSSDFQLEMCSDCVYISCLCGDEAKTFTWSVTPITLGELNFTVSAEALSTKEFCGEEIPIVPKKGKRDTLIKKLLVQAEGIPEEKTHSSFLCNGASEKVSLELPTNVVEGSERAQVSVTADIMSRSLKNVDRLLAMPHGCGEQNMAKFAPNVDVLDYLRNTGQLTPKIEENAKRFLESGYQRQLNYRHQDGSYSAFGENDASGSTLLTVLVAKYFGRAKSFTYIDDKYITEAVNWLKSKQMESGCFRSVGKLLDNSLQGGVDDVTSLTAYITAGLLELGIGSNDKVVQNAFQCLDSSATNASSLYTMALLAYVYTLDENKVKRSELLNQLEMQAITSGGKKHWSQTPEQPTCAMFWCQPRSEDVQITSYVMLTLMSKKPVLPEDITAAMPIAKWLTGQQNANGGFSSTQDTMLALQALAKYASDTYSPSGEMTLSVRHKDTVIREFSVNDQNRLLLQQELLSDISGEYTLQASGEGCLYAQTTLRYNVPSPSTRQTFLLDLEVSAKHCKIHRITMHTSYVGNRATSNMVLIEVKMLSGFVPVKDSLKWLQKHPLVKKTETKKDKVIIYLEELSDQTQTFTFLMEQDFQVKGLKPATVKVYDYYKSEDNAMKEYNSPCTQELPRLRHKCCPVRGKQVEAAPQTCMDFFFVCVCKMLIELSVCYFLLLQRTAGQSPNPYYMVTLPAVIYHPSLEKVCAHVKGASASAQLTVTLQLQSTDHILIDKNTGGQDFFTCVDFQVPAPYDGEEEVATIWVSLDEPAKRFDDSKQVVLRQVLTKPLILTDKPSYNRGDTVQIHCAIFDRNFLPSTKKVPVVDIQDPNGHHIAQWHDLTPIQGIIARTFDLSRDAVLGTYTISVQHLKSTKSFLVEKTVMQKFEVLILSFPSVITLEDTSFELKVCGRYTHGKPTQGHTEVTVCRRAKHFSWSKEGRKQDLCMEFSGQTDSSGCLSWTLNTITFQPSVYGYQMAFDVIASLREEGTDMKVKTNNSFPLSSTIAVVTFDNTDTYYKPFVPYKAKMRLVSADGSPMKTKTVFLGIEVSRKKTELVAVTDGSGSAYFTLDTFSWKGNTVYLKGIYKKDKPMAEAGHMVPYYKDAVLTVSPFYSLVNTVLKIHAPNDTLSCGQNHELEVDFIVRSSDVAAGEDHLLLQYFLVGRGKIVHNGQKLLNVSRTSVLKGSFGLTVPVSADIAPVGKILIYTILPGGKISADSTQFRVSKCFKNKVNLEFSELECLPSSNVSLVLHAAPGSTCAVQVLDKNVLLARPAAELSSDSIYRLLPVLNQEGYPDSVMEVDPQCWGHLGGMHSIRIPFSNQNYRDDFGSFQRMGLKIITNIEMKKPLTCNYYHPPMASQTSDDELRTTLEGDDQSTLYTEDMKSQHRKIRSNFPHNLVWELISINSSGIANMPLTVPDTITDWEAFMFCTADIGIGLSLPARLRAFKTLFLEMRLPDSLVRGESVTVHAIVFNYMHHSIQIQVTMVRSRNFEMWPCRNCTYTSCLRAEESKTFSWNVTALVLGTMTFQVTAEAVDRGELCFGERPAVPENGGTDTVVKEVLVQAEGVLQELSHSSLLCAEGNLSTEVIPIDLPNEVIPGSATAQFSIVGDMTGNALQNMNNQLAMPYGCGEQTMSKLAPNIFIMRYLNSSGQLTESIKAKALRYIEAGYQRFQDYRRVDGSFSAFGERDQEGNMWLTALAVKCLYAAKPHIVVDEHYIREAAAWIEDNQLPTGAFCMKGQLFKNLIKDRTYASNDESIALTSFVVTALLESGWQSEEPMLDKALQYLRNATPDVENPYPQALMAYAFTLSGKTDEGNRALVLRKLYEKAVKQEGQVYWNLKSKQNTRSQFWSRSDSCEVEVAAYVLLAHMCKTGLPREELVKATQIAAWIPRQQNTHGGYTTTEDTLVALQALTSYATHTFSGSRGTYVTVTSPAGFKHDFTVNNSTRLLLQEVSLPDIPGEYRADARGNGCVYLQTTLRYHTPPPQSNEIFALRVEVQPWNCSDSVPTQLNLTIHVSYTGPWPASNMALLVTRMLSGYSADLDSVIMTETNPLVKKTEVAGNEIILYLDQLTSETQNLTFILKRDILVRNQQPENVKVYDYYKPDGNAVVEYNSPCPGR